MSCSREITVWCDAVDCGQWTYGDGAPEKDKRAARAAAARVGWSYGKPPVGVEVERWAGPMVDLCPAHPTGLGA